MAPETLLSDFTKMDDTHSIHLAFHVTHKFAAEHSGALPRAWHAEDATEFVRIAHELNAAVYKFDNLSDHILRLFASTARGQLCPMQAVLGGTAAQEVMKACSGKFSPISQYFYFDCREALPEKPFEKLHHADCVLSADSAVDADLRRYQAQVAVFGKDFQRRLGQSKYFLVGAGALGCEYLKNMAMIGMCTKAAGGKLIVTDMDTIEKSNLNRQFLFRPHDVQKFKANVAGAAAIRMNPQMSVEAHMNRVGPDTENLYDDEFFEKLDGVCNALDNIDARVYMDRRCVYYHKPLIESGTLGTKGNFIQTVFMVPNLFLHLSLNFKSLDEKAN